MGVALPFAGRDAGRALQARTAIALAVERANALGGNVTLLETRDTARHIANPHEDEGSDFAEEPERAALAAGQLAGEGAGIVIGGLRENVARAMRIEASFRNVTFVELDCDVPLGPHDEAFASRFRAVAGFAPTADAVRAYSATLAAIGEATSASVPSPRASSRACRAAESEKTCR